MSIYSLVVPRTATQAFLRKNRAVRRNQALRLAFMEQLEARTLLSTVDIGSGTLIFNDTGTASNVTISLASSTVEQVTDSNSIITLLPTAAILGWSGSGTHTVTGPTSSFAFIQVTGSSTAGDNLTLNYASGDPLPTAGLIFTPTVAAPGGTNRFFLQGGSFTSETYNGLASNVGNITYSDSNHTNTLITLINTNSVTDTTPASSLTVNTPSPATTVNIASGVIAGSVIYQVGDGGAGTFPFIGFDNKSIATVNANNANATITMSPSAAALGLTTLNLNATAGNETLNIQNTSSGVFTDVNTGNATNSTINIGNAGNTLAGIAGAIDITSLGTVNINDSSDTTHATATLDNASGNVVFPFEVAGLSTGLISYASGFSALNIKGGTSGSNGVTFNVNNTGATTTTLTGGVNQNSFNLSNAGESGGLNNLGAIVIHASAGFGDVITLNDSAANFSDNYTVTSTTVSRANFGGLTYSGNLGSLILNAENTIAGTTGNNTINVNGTANNVNTTINGQGGVDTINLNSTGSFGTVTLNTGGTAGSTINIVACSSPVSVNMNAAATVNIGSTGGAGTMTGIQAAVSLLNPPDFYTLNFHDENDTTAQNWTLNDDDGNNTGSIGLSSGSLISYRPGDLATNTTSLNINGGGGGNTFNVNGTAFNFTTTLNTGTGNDTTNVLGSANNNLTINGQDGSDTLNLGNNGSAQGLNGNISVTNNADFTTVNVDDSQDATARTIALSDDGTTETVTGIAPAILHLLDTDVSALNLDGGTGGNTFTVNNISAGFVNTLNTGSGNDTVNAIAAPGGELKINGQGGADTVTLGSNSSLQALFGTINIGNSGGNTTLNLNNTADTTARATSIFDADGSTTIFGLSNATFAYSDTGVGTVNLSTGATADTITVSSTGADATLNITTSGAVAGNTVNIIACSAPVNITNHASDTVNIGSTGGNGTMTGIHGAIFVQNPPTLSTLNLHDEDDSTAATWTLNADSNSNHANVTLGGTSTISWNITDVGTITINAGSGGNTFNVDNTAGRDGFGNIVTTNLNSGTGQDTVNVFATGDGILNINGQNSLDTVNLGGLANIGMQNLTGTINFSNPNNFNNILLDDSQDTTGRVTAISDDGTTGTITGLAPAVISYADNDTNLVNITTGSGDDSATVNSNHVNLLFNDIGGNNTLAINGQGLSPTATARSEPNEVLIAANDSNGDSVIGSIDAINYRNLNFTNTAPTALVPGSTQTVTSVVHTGFINANVADFTLNAPTFGAGVPIGDFSSSIAWGDGSPNSAGTVTRDPNNPNHYFITGSHIFSSIGAFTDSNTVSFAGSGSYVSSLNGVTISIPLTTFTNSAGANGTAISTTPNTSFFVPGPAKTATAGKLLKKITIQIKTPANKLDVTDNSAVTLTVTGPGGFANGSITTVNAVKGKATFSHLQLNIAGTYHITELNGEKTINSQTFTVLPSTVTSLTISSPPTSPNNTTALSFTVHAFDAFGNSVAKAPIKLAIASGPSKAKIVGTVSATTAANGTATFSNLFLHTAGPYTLKATSKSASITTSLFDIT